MKKKLLAGFIAVFCLVGVSVMAQAMVLTPGYNTLPGTTVLLQPDLAGTVVEDDSVSFSFTPSSGVIYVTVQSRVVLSVDGTYDFYWRIRDTSGDGEIGSLRIADFFTSIYDADYRIDSSGTLGPDQALLFNPPTDGNINFIFSKGLGAAAGQESKFFFLDTDAHNYAKTARFDLTGTGTGGISSMFATFAPAPVPVPGTLLLLGSGFIGLIGFRRKWVS